MNPHGVSMISYIIIVCTGLWSLGPGISANSASFGLMRLHLVKCSIVELGHTLPGNLIWFYLLFQKNNFKIVASNQLFWSVE